MWRATAWPTLKTVEMLVCSSRSKASGGKLLQRGAVLHAGVVHQDVDGADLGLEPVHRAARTASWSVASKASVMRTGDAALRPPEFRRVAAVQHDLRACGRQALRQRKPDPLRRPGDQRPPPRQIEQRKAHRKVIHVSLRRPAVLSRQPDRASLCYR